MIRAVLHSKVVLGLGVVVAVAVPALTLPRLPHVSIWPVLLGLVPWVVGKYLLCPLRWRALTDAGLSRWWHVRASAEAELLGLFTPGNIGADIWRVRRLTHHGLARGDAIASVGLDRLVGAVGITVFVACAGAALPASLLVAAVGLAVGLLVAVLVVRRLRPGWLPRRRWPTPRQLLHGLWLSAVFQATTAGLLLATLAATGHTLSPLALLGAFGASQLAGAIPGPHGASPREGALVVGLVALGIPVTAAAAAVALSAAIAWLPALLLGGTSLLRTRRTLHPTVEPPLALA
ncbi:MAG TPA: lysylphosphatidylglycerol synthase domain-containing protein [Marmoricola sp.]|nr:lysylphosphatidylglycerol synthase domain-containing protein [Marmoricola sp.]